jgi:hypothetical protein
MDRRARDTFLWHFAARGGSILKVTDAPHAPRVSTGEERSVEEYR